jgi:transposase
VRPSRHVRDLSQAEVADLDQAYRATDSADLRSRCQIILLSHEGYTTAQTAKLVRFSEDTILYWLDRYEAEGVPALEDRPRPGRPPKSRRPV